MVTVQYPYQDSEERKRVGRSVLCCGMAKRTRSLCDECLKTVHERRCKIQEVYIGKKKSSAPEQ